MTAAKFLKVNSDGKTAEQAASDTSSGVGDAGKIVALNSSGVLDPTLLPPGVATDTITATAFEDLSAGDFVYVRQDGQIGKAIATSAGALAMGFVLANYATSATATVYLDTRNTALSGLVPGTTYFLSATVAGAVTEKVVTTAGQYVQSLGRALSATVLSVEFEDGILRA